MKDTRSPIQRMIDAACGFDPNAPLPPPKPRTGQIIRCPKCKREQPCQRHRSDPKRTKVVVANCPECAGDFEEVRYFDKNGVELIP